MTFFDLHPEHQQMTKNSVYASEVSALGAVLEALGPLDAQQQYWVVSSAVERLGIQRGPVRSEALSNRSSQKESNGSGLDQSELKDVTPKQFIDSKSPRTDVERVACLAYYLAHARGQSVIKTENISKLNTEAAQPKLSNASVAIRNATSQSGFLADAGRGQKQITALGEKVVMALPDRDAVKIAIENAKSRRRKARRSKKQEKAS
jgi:hypothetical protein